MGLHCMSGAHVVFRHKNKDVHVCVSDSWRQETSLLRCQVQIPILLFVCLTQTDTSLFFLLIASTHMINWDVYAAPLTVTNSLVHVAVIAGWNRWRWWWCLWEGLGSAPLPVWSAAETLLVWGGLTSASQLNPESMVYVCRRHCGLNSTTVNDFLTGLFNVTQISASHPHSPPTTTTPTVSFQVYSKSTFVLAAIEEVLLCAASTKVFSSLPSKW